MDGFQDLRCLNNCIDLPNKIELFAVGTTNPLVDKNWNKIIFVISIMMLWYLEAKFDYGYFILYYSYGYYNSTQKISAHFEQK